MNECERCHRVIPGNLCFIRGCDIQVCKDCAHEAYTKCQCCGGYFAGEDIVYPETGDAMCIWCVSDRYLICPHCCEYIRKDEAVEFHGLLMCGDCRDNYFSQCDCCHERFETTELMDAINEYGEFVRVCPKCLLEKFQRCTDCGSLVENPVMFEGKPYCSDCCEKCWNCGKKTPINELEPINTADGSHDVCPACYPLFDQCGFCGNECLKEKLHEIDGDWYCEACLPKYIAQLEGEEKAQAMRQLDASLVGIAAGLAIFGGLNMMNKRGHDQPRGLSEAQLDDGYPDDYVGDGLDGTDDHVGDGLDGPVI